MLDDAIVKLELRVQRLANKHGASVYRLRDDVAVLAALLQDEVELAEGIICEQYAYCDEHDDDHGDCKEVN